MASAEFMTPPVRDHRTGVPIDGPVMIASATALLTGTGERIVAGDAYRRDAEIVRRHPSLFVEFTPAPIRDVED